MTDQAVNKPGEDAPMAHPSESCEHHWGAHHYPGTRIYWITTCTLCGTLNVADFNEQIDALVKAGEEQEAARTAATTPEPAAVVHAMQDDWPNGVTPCCGIRSRDQPVGTHWTTWPAKITCPGVADPAALIAATETSAPEPRCSAHRDARCAMCSRNDGRTCEGCSMFEAEGMHWDTCPNRDRTPLAEPEWLTSLRRDMQGEVRDVAILTEASDSEEIRMIAERATGVAASYLHPLHTKVAELEVGQEADEARIAELVENVRALGGDPDRMVDPRDASRRKNNIRTAMNAALEAHGQRLNPATFEVLVSAAAGMAALDCPAPAPVVREVPADDLGPVLLVRQVLCKEGLEPVEASRLARVVAGAVRERWTLHYLGSSAVASEVPAGEAREGDTVTYVRRGTVDRLYHHQTGRLGVIWEDDPGKAITVTRPVSPLPDQPGAFGLGKVRGHGDIKRRLLLVRRNGALVWSGIDGTYEYGQVADFEPLPAGAGVPEGGKR